MHGRIIGDEAHDAQRPENGKAADDGGEAGRHHTAEDEEQQHRHQRDGRHLGALLVDADRSGELVGQRVEATQFDIAVVDRLQIRRHGLIILQDLVVAVTFERNADERLAHVRGLHLRNGGVGAVGRA